ncbi:LysR family transcriptional regulator [Phaeobacter sp. J2-8]|uniref:LysR substrate-binding domain-containing protein n=1 Tax=Phaeobacter sp. J2-8 TaxID=2931394 RepID=UPI001FD0CD6D|nr:LysR family transcriptional regulator [Phaeobacter sp. J2-8]MCJ7873922.1 LysR family transcriptional regulator [Phaeobacter sp. J2-8]
MSDTDFTPKAPVDTGPDPRLEVSDLRVIVAVAEAGSFSGAAQAMGMSQPGVSLRIARLEERLGLKLFQRRKPMTLTDTGFRIFNQARTALLHFDKVLQSVDELKSGQGGLLRVGFSVPQVAMPILRRFVTRFPDVTIKLQQRNSHSLLEDVARISVDVGILTWPDADQISNEHVVLAQQELVLVHNAAMMSLGAGPIDRAALSEHRIVVQKQPSMTRTVVDRLFEANAMMPKHLFEAPRREAVIEAAAAGLGAGLVFASEMPPDGRLQQTRLDLIQPGAKLLLVIADGARGIPAVSHFLDIAAEPG